MLIVELHQITDEVVDAFANLVPQLSSSSPPPVSENLDEAIASSGTTLLVARTEAGIVGALTLITFRTPWGVRARIEEVVVDEPARGDGVGSALVRAAIEKAGALGSDRVELSRPSRGIANEMYRRLGFQQRETNVYRFDLRDS